MELAKLRNHLLLLGVEELISLLLIVLLLLMRGGDSSCEKIDETDNAGINANDCVNTD